MALLWKVEIELRIVGLILNSAVAWTVYEKNFKGKGKVCIYLPLNLKKAYISIIL